MHVITKDEKFTLMGRRPPRQADAVRRGRAARAGAFKHVGLRVSDLEAARAALPDGTPDVFDAGEGICADARRGARPTWSTTSTTSRCWSADPEATAPTTSATGSRLPGPSRVEVGGAFVELHQGDPGDRERPLLNHLAVLVDSADEVIADAEDLGIEVESVVDAANTYAAFLWGPERVRIEYVEHKPTFSLT